MRRVLTWLAVGLVGACAGIIPFVAGLNPNEVVIVVGETVALAVELEGGGVGLGPDERPALTVESNNPQVATARANFQNPDEVLVTGVAPGQTTVAVSNRGNGPNVPAPTALVTVISGLEVELEPSEVELQPGQQITLACTVRRTTTGETVTDEPVTFSTTNQAAAIVADDGTVTAIIDGVADIICQTQFGDADTTRVTVRSSTVNAPPVAVDDEATTRQGDPVTVNVLANDSDPDADPIRVVRFDLVEPAPSGSGIFNNEDGTLIIDPGPTFTGTFQIEYTIADDRGAEATAIVTIGVVPNRPPVPMDDEATTRRGTPVTVDVLSNDSDPDADPIRVVRFDLVEPAPSGAGIFNNEDGTLIIDPGPTFTGTFQIEYTIADDRGGEASARVTVTVVPDGVPTAIRVAVFNDFNIPINPDAAAFREEDGEWNAMNPTGTGLFDFQLGAGITNYSVAIRCDDLVQTRHVTTDDATEMAFYCPAVNFGTANFALTFSGVEQLGTGTQFGVEFYGPRGLITSRPGSAGALTVPNHPAVQQDLVAVGMVDGVALGARFMGDVTPTDGATFDFTFTQDDRGGTAVINEFQIEPGSTGEWVEILKTPGASVTVGFGNETGGTYYTAPYDGPDGNYIGIAATSSPSGGGVSHSVVQAVPGDVTHQLPPPWNGFTPPNPAATLTFTGLTTGGFNHRGYRFTTVPTSPGQTAGWAEFVSDGRLGNDTEFTMSNPMTMPGFEDLAPSSGDPMAYVAENIWRNMALSLTLTAFEVLGVPVRDGVDQQVQTVSAGYTVP